MTDKRHPKKLNWFCIVGCETIATGIHSLPAGTVAFFCLWRPYRLVPTVDLLRSRLSETLQRYGRVMFSTVQHSAVQCGTVSPYRHIPNRPVWTFGCRWSSKAMLDFDSMSPYCSVPLVAVRYRHHRLTTYRAVPISPSCCVPYWPVRTSWSWAEF